MTSDAVTLIRADHRIMADLLDQLRDPTGDRAPLLDQLAARLIAHGRAEEQEIYPAIVAVAPAETDEVELGIAEHRETERKLRVLQSLNPAAAEFMPALRDLTDTVRQHVEEEEVSVLPELARLFAATDLGELGAAYDRRRRAELRARGVDDEMAEALRERG
ncbi:Hemerythrin HHE cation binding domain-containing protein [Micromonospora pattaloongensis]|uniref:Hemerythrin HHE cation binding domain-containing protein n=1 Tax=Micromonospora pattaloongensis TaxID=405436 RepID=A0A1H3JFA7_9ACTN|nr:hemerythrin domain-containing protein [Micromonospora pattaloongensis]SDY38626.1 Hemerythrin HHE cation binding domain-containing protein [Micromonospora pattaloongensis]